MHAFTHYLGLLLDPFYFVVAALVLAQCLQLWPTGKWSKRGRSLSYAAVISLPLLGWQAVPDYGLYYLESRYQQTEMMHDSPALSSFKGVVVLGGATVSGRLQDEHPGQVLFNEAGERLVVSALLAKAHPDWTLLYTGGEGDPQGTGSTEAARARQIYEAMGVPVQQILYEEASQNTYENAVLSANLAGIDSHQPWLLLTSAWHMPRAMGTFEKAGWNVTPYPVDYRAEAEFRWSNYDLHGGIQSWSTLIHEVAGILTYRLRGRM